MAVIIVMIVTLILFSFYIHVKEKRSALSFVSEMVLRLSVKKIQEGLGDESGEYLAKQAVKNEVPYTLPIKGLAHCTITLEIRDEIEVVVFRPRRKKSVATILYLHGGGYVEHASIVHFFFIDSIQRMCPSTLYMPIYPKAPVHQAPFTVSKTKSIYTSLVQEIQEPLFLMGDSAGGGLALAVAQEIKQQPSHIILISPWLDISLRNPLIKELQEKDPMLHYTHLKNMGISYKGNLDETDPKVSPLFGDITNLAPMTFFVGTHEIFLADARDFHRKCIASGKEINYIEKERMNHDYPLFPMKEGREAVAIIAKVLKGETLHK